MAEVWDAYDDRLGRSVAVKIMHPALAAARQTRAGFEAEARAAARLSHPNVVAVYDTGETDGVPWIVMERLPGDTLADLIRTGPLVERQVVSIGLEVLSALQAAHAAGVLHRDVKPANILLGEEGTAKVADFGIAKAATGPDGRVATADFVVGTPAYLPPERFVGAPASPLSDIWSLAAVMYEAAAGAPPYTTEKSVTATALARSRPPVPLRQVAPQVSDELSTVLDRALSPDPASRYPSAAAMARALPGKGSLAAGPAEISGSAVTLPPVTLPPVTVPAVTVPAVTGRAAHAVRRRGRGALWGTAAATAIAAAALVLIPGGRHHADAHTFPSGLGTRGGPFAVKAAPPSQTGSAQIGQSGTTDTASTSSSNTGSKSSTSTASPSSAGRAPVAPRSAGASRSSAGRAPVARRSAGASRWSSTTVPASSPARSASTTSASAGHGAVAPTAPTAPTPSAGGVAASNTSTTVTTLAPVAAPTPTSFTTPAPAGSAQVTPTSTTVTIPAPVVPPTSTTVTIPAPVVPPSSGRAGAGSPAKAHHKKAGHKHHH